MDHIIANIIFPAIASILAGLFLWRYQNKPKLNFYFITGCATAFPTKERKADTIVFPQLMISLTILNGGKVPLKNVQIFHTVDISYDMLNQTGNNRVVALGISPNTPHEFNENGKILIFKSLVPKERITINYIYPVSSNLSDTNVIHQFYPSGVLMMRSDETIGQPITFVEQVVNFPQWVRVIAWIMLIVGFWVSVSFLVNLITLVNSYNKLFC